MSPKRGLPKPPLFTSDYIAMAEILKFAMEQFGQLILALMYYTMDGTLPDELPSDLSVMFSIYQRKIDAAREKYDRTCSARAESGAKGGRAKAENAKAKSAASKFRPPTQKQFGEAVEHFVDEGEISEDTGNYESDSFFDELQTANWTINGEPITSRSDWELAIRAKFYDFGDPFPPHRYYSVFASLFAGLHGCRTSDGKSNADDLAFKFMSSYDSAAHRWVIQGEEFSATAWEKALARFMEEYGKHGND